MKFCQENLMKVVQIMDKYFAFKKKKDHKMPD